MDLETYQRGLQRMVTHGKPTPDDPTYIQDLANTSRLTVVREVVFFWQAYDLERFCILTARLLKQQGRFETDVENFVSSEKYSPFVEEAGQQFLTLLTRDNDLMVAAVAKTELALHKTYADFLEEEVVNWPCNPEPILDALINQNKVFPELFAPSLHRLRISRSFPGGYICEVVEDPALD